MRILVVQLRRLGDILLSSPAVEFLKINFPDSQIDFLTEPSGAFMLKNNPNISETIVYDKAHPINEIVKIRQKKYDVIYDFMNNPRTSHLTFLSGAKDRVAFRSRGRGFFYNVSIPTPMKPEYVPLRKIRLVKSWMELNRIKISQEVSLRPKIYLDDDDHQFASQWMKHENLDNKSFVVLAPVHRHKIRQWRLDGFKNIAKELSLKIKVYLAWGPGEKSEVESIVSGTDGQVKLLPDTSMRQMAAVFSHAKFLLTNDSGAMHLSVAVGTPTVTIYGPTRPIDWNPSLTGENEFLDRFLTEPSVACLGCHLLRCDVGHLCMNRLSESNVLKVCNTFI
jgi:ADP-heptose:LPS heptosyltransferase